MIKLEKITNRELKLLHQNRELEEHRLIVSQVEANINKNKGMPFVLLTGLIGVGSLILSYEFDFNPVDMEILRFTSYFCFGMVFGNTIYYNNLRDKRYSNIEDLKVIHSELNRRGITE